MTFWADKERPNVFFQKDLSTSKKCGVHCDLFSALKPLLRFGQIFGICPYHGLWDNSFHKLAYTLPRWNSPKKLSSYFIILILSINLLMNLGGMVRKVFFGDPNPIQVAWALFPPMFYATGLHTYVNFCCRAENIHQLCLHWRRSTEELHVSFPNTKSWIPTYTLRLRCLSAIILTSAVLENVVYHTRYDCAQTNCKLGDGERNFSVLEEYYWREHRDNWASVPYNPLVTVLLFVANKLTVIATNYSDVFIISVAGLAGAKFRDFVKVVQVAVEHDDVDWSRIRDDYQKLRSLIEQVSHCLSAITFSSMALLLELISTQVHLAISTDSEKPFMAKVYSVWSFLHLAFRFILICIVCSTIPEQTTKLQIILYQSRSSKFSSLQILDMTPFPLLITLPRQAMDFVKNVLWGDEGSRRLQVEYRRIEADVAIKMAEYKMKQIEVEQLDRQNERLQNTELQIVQNELDVFLAHYKMQTELALAKIKAELEHVQSKLELEKRALELQNWEKISAHEEKMREMENQRIINENYARSYAQHQRNTDRRLEVSSGIRLAILATMVYASVTWLYPGKSLPSFQVTLCLLILPLGLVLTFLQKPADAENKEPSASPIVKLLASGNVSIVTIILFAGFLCNSMFSEFMPVLNSFISMVQVVVTALCVIPIVALPFLGVTNKYIS